MLDAIVDLVEGSLWGYVAIFGICWADCLFPAIPGEGALITGAILAAQDAMFLPVVFVVGWAAGALGDLTAYALGRRFGQRLRDRLMRKPRMARYVTWTEHQLERRGETIIVVARFIPTARTATSYTSGALGFPLRRFLPAEVLAAALWAGFVCTVGYVGGASFRDSLLKPLLFATAVAVLLGLAAEGVRRRRLAD